jgi:hypothetical protein
MPGAITAHAQFRLAQLETLAREAAEDVVGLQKTYDTQSEALATFADGPTTASVAAARENLENAKARATGAEAICKRFAARSRVPVATRGR